MHKATFLFISLLTYFTSFSFSIRDQFYKIPTEKKVAFYRNLTLENKLLYNHFFKNYFKNSISRIENENLKNDFIFCLALIYQTENNHINAIEAFNLLINTRGHEIPPRVLMDSYVGLQESYLKLNIYSKVFEINKKIETLIRNGYEYPLWSYNIQSRLYFQLKQYKKAIEQLKREIHLLSLNKKRDSLIFPSALNDLGLYYYNANNNKAAMYYYIKSLTITNKQLKNNKNKDFVDLFTTIKTNISNIYIKEKKYKLAFKEYTNYILPNKKYLVAETVISNDLAYGNILLSLNKFHELDSLIKTFKTKKTSILNNKTNLLQLKINYYKLLQNYKTVNLLQDSIIKLKAEYTNNLEKKIRESSELNYFFNKKEQKAIKDEAKIKDIEKNIYLIIIVCLIILVLLGLIFSYSMKKKKNKIEEMNLSIKNSLTEKEYLLKEIHHRVKNNLQIISGIIELQKLNIENDALKLILEDGQTRIKSIALVHQMLYQSKNFKSINVDDFLKELVNTIKKTLNSKTIETKIISNKVFLNINTAIPLSIIINELITNSTKHAFLNIEKPKINIEVRETKNNIELIYKDNGIGFPEHVLNNNINSVGLDLIIGLSKQLNGKIIFLNQNGACINLLFLNN